MSASSRTRPNENENENKNTGQGQSQRGETETETEKEKEKEKNHPTMNNNNISGLSPESRRKGSGMSFMEDMPCVFTRGDGPNGRRIEGILYKYGKGEEVRIMCVCHGSFLSPAEFVKHAGGGDVAHPLRHIVVNPSSSASSL